MMPKVFRVNNNSNNKFWVGNGSFKSLLNIVLLKYSQKYNILIKL